MPPRSDLDPDPDPEPSRKKGSGGDPGDEEDEPLSPEADRALSGLPFLFGGGLALFLAYELRSAATRSGVPPLWVLFLTLGAVALVAGLLLVFTSEPTAEDEEEEAGDRVILPRKEWDHLQRELHLLRRAQDRGEAAPPPGHPREPPGRGAPVTAPPPAAPAPADGGMTEAPDKT